MAPKTSPLNRPANASGLLAWVLFATAVALAVAEVAFVIAGRATGRRPPSTALLVIGQFVFSASLLGVPTLAVIALVWARRVGRNRLVRFNQLLLAAWVVGLAYVWVARL